MSAAAPHRVTRAALRSDWSKRNHGAALIPGGKVCRACGLPKRSDEYSRNAKTADGRATSCKACASAYQARWRAENAERRAEYRQEYAQANRETILQKKRAYAEANRDRESERACRWAREHPDKIVLRSKTRRARERGNGGTLTPVEWMALCAHYGHVCLACGKKRKLEPDHVIPVKMGGRGDVSNIQPLCRSCNASKGARIIDYRPQRETGNAAA